MKPDKIVYVQALYEPPTFVVSPDIPVRYGASIADVREALDDVLLQSRGTEHIDSLITGVSRSLWVSFWRPELERLHVNCCFPFKMPEGYEEAIILYNRQRDPSVWPMSARILIPSEALSNA
jgi:hypothetical protein